MDNLTEHCRVRLGVRVSIAVARMHTGIVDTTFGTSGLTTTTFGTTSVIPSVDVLQADGKLVLGASPQTKTDGSTSSQLGLARYTTTGVLDTSLGTARLTLTNMGAASYYSGLAVQSTGRAGFSA